MTELAALNVRVQGDSGGLVAALNAAEGAVTSFGRVATAAEANSRGFDRALRNAGGGATEAQRSINSLTGVLDRSRKTAEASARVFDRLGLEAATAGTQIGNAGIGAARFSNGMNSAQGSLGNFAAQFNDIGVMLAAGQSPLMLALQQGTQINQAFDAMGAAGATASGRMQALGAAFASVVSPANLLTIGVIAGGAALFQLGMSALGARDQVTLYNDALEGLEAITNDVQRASDILNTSMFDLIEQYGSAATRVRELALAEIELAIARQRGAVAQAMVNEELQSALSEYGGLTRVVGILGEVFYDTSDAVRAIERDLHVSGQTAADLALAFNQLRNASTMEETLSAWNEINSLLSEAGISLSDLPPSLAQALSGVVNLEQAMIDYTAAVSRAAQETQALAAAMPMTTGGVGPGVFGPDGMIRMPPAAPVEPPSGGGGGGGRSLADQIEADLERLREGFMSEEELQIASYQRQQELLEEALNRRLITQQEFAALMEQAQVSHQEQMAEIDVYRYGTGLQQAGQFFGDMANALKNGNDEMARISRVFAAGEALVNAWRAHNQTLANPSLPSFAKIPAALSILSAGMRAVSAIGGSSGGGAASAASAGAAAGGNGSAMGQRIFLNVQPNARGDIPMQTFRGVVDSINDQLNRGGRIVT